MLLDFFPWEVLLASGIVSITYLYCIIFLLLILKINCDYYSDATKLTSKIRFLKLLKVYKLNITEHIVCIHSLLYLYILI